MKGYRVLRIDIETTFPRWCSVRMYGASGIVVLGDLHLRKVGYGYIGPLAY